MSGAVGRRSATTWAGVDVGAAKGFDVAAVDRHRLVGGPERIGDVSAVVRWLREQGPAVVAVDSPRSPAPDGERSRPDERAFAAAGVCGIRFTPDAAALAGNPAYYGWVLHGFELFAALEAAPEPWHVIECFPTATWSRLGGPRGTSSRARWSRRVLSGLGLSGVPTRISQDARDAVAAALTARLHDDGQTESFGEIVVPRGPRAASTPSDSRSRSGS